VTYFSTRTEAVLYSFTQTIMRIAMRTILFTLLVSLFTLSAAIGQQAKVTETTFKVFGNCGMCKNRIENVLKIKEVKMAKWDKTSKMLTVAYLASSITLDSLQQRIAAVGHDNGKFVAPDSVYEALPGCCLYRDGESTH
jgi:mercuric ion binding protein